MKAITRVLLAAALLSLGATAAAADFSANVAATSDYRFRGVSQSARDPALQGGVDFSQDGFYLGLWGSTIDFGPGADADLEVDLYGGYEWSAAGVDWDAGFIHYAYPGSESSADLDFTEIYIGGSYGPVFAKYYYSDDFTGPGSASAYYATAGVELDIGRGYALALSAGVSDGDAYADGYTDYRIGVAKDFDVVSVDLSYIDTSGTAEVTDDVFNNEGTVVLTVSKTF